MRNKENISQYCTIRRVITTLLLCLVITTLSIGDSSQTSLERGKTLTLKRLRGIGGGGGEGDWGGQIEAPPCGFSKNLYYKKRVKMLYQIFNHSIDTVELMFVKGITIGCK